MVRSAQQVPAQKQVVMAQLDGVKSQLMKGADEDEHEGHEGHDHDENSEHHHHHGEYNMHLWLSQRLHGFRRLQSTIN